MVGIGFRAKGLELWGLIRIVVVVVACRACRNKSRSLGVQLHEGQKGKILAVI